MEIGDRVIYKKYSFDSPERGYVSALTKDGDEIKFVLDLDNGECVEAKEDEVTRYFEPDRPVKTSKMSKAYKIWAAGMTLSLLGILGGQWLGEVYKEPLVYYIVSGIWATLIGGSSAIIGIIILSKSNIE